ncbi:MAG: FAD-dependent oxidoreductase [Anaerolineales bacterium]
MKKFHEVVIGAGSTGAAIAHDLTLRGIQVTLVERFGPAAGTTGHNQAQLHSGARYAVTDPISARECIEENMILRKIMPNSLELNDGLFIALNEEHLEYRKSFLDACGQVGIPTKEVSPAQALRMEPRLNPDLLAAIQIPDGVFDPYRFTLRFIATACKNGADFLPFTTVTALDPKYGQITIHHGDSDKTEIISCDVIINAAGPWAPQIAEMADIALALEPSAGVMVTVQERLCNMVINLLALPDDGDIIVPQRNTSILGTTSWVVEDPDNIPIPPDHITRLQQLADWIIPGSGSIPIRGVMAAARPLIKGANHGGRSASRTYQCCDHAKDGAPGFFSIIGGKTTTARHMAEKISDMVCAYLGVDIPCTTRDEMLALHHLRL